MNAPSSRPPAPAPATDHDRFVARALSVVGGWCRRLAPPGVDPDEATQDVVLILLDRLPRLHPGLAWEALAFGITRRVLANHRRRAWWRRWLPGAVPERVGAPGDTLVELGRARTAERVTRLLQLLPEAQREVLVLCDAEERTAAEVALLLGVPEGTVRSRLRLGRARFRTLAPRFDLAPPDGDEP